MTHTIVHDSVIPAVMQPQPVVRFFCSADASELGLLALAYTDAMVSMGFSVRLVATRMAALQDPDERGPGVGWVKHHRLFLTSLDNTGYVNVVCGDPWDYKRLYTVGVNNLLLTSSPPPLEADELRAATKYQHVVVPNDELGRQWQAAGANVVVVPMNWAKHAQTLRYALTTTPD